MIFKNCNLFFTRQILQCAMNFLVLAVLVTTGSQTSATEITDTPPSTKTQTKENPDVMLKKLEVTAPKLSGKGEEARANAIAFIDWASSSTKKQSDLVRKSIASARDNADIISAICDEAFASKEKDHSRALIALSLLGEARSRHGEACLTKFVQLPLPDKGTVVEGEILEQTALETLQAKAIDGLAYLKSPTADRVVLETISKHPSRIVRAEAIAAYLWNNKYSAQAKEKLKSFVHQDEQIFIDRVVREEGEAKESFNRKLEAFLKAHPELYAPAPTKIQNKQKKTKPPEF